MDGTALPQLRTEVPGPKSVAAIDVLARHECPAITARRARRAATIGTARHDPIVWDAALGANVRDLDGNVFVDLTSGFGVALVGHRHPQVVAAVLAQNERLPHAMGDVFPDATRIRLLERLAHFAPPGLTVSLLGLSGSDAVDGALKTAILATGRAGVLVFDGAYHGLALGTLGLQGYQASFTEPFRSVVHPAVFRLPYGAPRATVERVLAEQAIGLILVEPILGRGGIVEAPPGWLAELADCARRGDALIAFDEIQCGLGRTGRWFAADHEGVVPDLLCVGKALGGGWPISACVGTSAVMAAWGASTGEAIHTQTFLGHPSGTAAALAVLDLLDAGGIAEVAERGEALAAALRDSGRSVRGRGLMRAVTIGTGALAASRRLLARGFLVSPAGPDSLQLLPPMTITDPQIAAFVAALDAA